MTAHLKKAELHCHIEGATPPELALAQAEKYGIDTSAIIRDRAYVWEDFTSFVKCYDAIASLFRTEEDYALLAEAYLTELAEAGTIYSEIIVSPDHGNTIGLGAKAYLEGLAAGMEAARQKTGIESRMLITGIRHLGPESVIKTAEFAARREHALVTGFNLAGEERMHNVADFARAFDIVRDAGLGLTIHAGELSGAFSVRDALDHVHPSRISHGVRAIEDMDLVRRLADAGVVLEVCPGSNISLQVFPDFASHPLRALYEAGVRVTLNSDDPPFFHTSLAQEYDIASAVMGFTDEEINRMTRTAIEAAFVDEPTRQRLLARI
ncbi:MULTISPECIES: adenosine deaminase [Sinorhizobium/Ensifer group]|uniref:adenosine deaminase n=1 Tax=Sinorhizobium/Ensifer group TaxID=227292 RepID=UPI00070CEE99|nr:MULTISPECIES: adenosine deaminase [Sinorhizobium/Ensifer group]KRD72849.1 adenosine deaminase [Ensifer sp. Root278]KSV69614.1 adenosine deaminase [Sinorhizobium sp. Sb3]KSV86534.1 adenosine deaminase [Sinorhizobium sp. GL28]MBD9505168.1 adenosine deaminase [Ensifer sp. ENS10]MBV7516996.1 adenosine deaminase [Ensifer sp. ENS12]